MEAGPAAADSAEPVPAVDNLVVVDFRFDWEEPVAAAVFHRAGALWVIFDKTRAVDLAALQQRGGNLIRAVDSLPVERATVLRLDTVAGVNPSLRRDGLAWILEFRQQAFQVATPIETLPQPNSPVGSRVFLPVTEPGRAIPLVDPAIGDNLVAVPVVPLGHGVSQVRRFPQFQLLPTIQGIVVHPRIDDLRVRTLRQGVELTSAGGLSVSPISARLRSDLTIGSLRPLTRVFDLERWRNLTIEDFTEAKQDLQQVVARAGPDERERRRLDLARFYFSMGFEAEALGVLEFVRRERPEVAELPEFRAMRGASSMMMGREDDAAADLNHASLDENDEGIFWRAALKAQTGDPKGAAATLKRKGSIVRPYPKPLKMPLGLLIADTAITVGDIRHAQQYLQVLANDEPDENQLAQIDFVTGRMAELAGDFDGAIIKWENVIESRHRAARANAARAQAELLMKTDEITRSAGIDILESLRFAWRGDEFEFTLLRRLGDLYLAEDRYREGLRTLRQAATYFRQHEEASAVTRKMAETFFAMYMEDKADALAPVTAIALYEEFKELTPAGERGDEMVRKLADRLVAVDLLDRAAELLETQVQFRLKGVDKARVGAQLALVYILDQQPEKALETLNGSEFQPLPEELVVQRNHLRARTMLDADQSEEALALLKDDKSLNADLLRLEAHWNRQQWAKAASTLRRIARLRGVQGAGELDDSQAQTILNLAVALTLSGNQRAVNRLRRDIGPAMDKTSYKDAFRLIASNQTQGLEDYRSIADKVVIAENFRGFMDAYKERLKADRLSSIN